MKKILRSYKFHNGTLDMVGGITTEVKLIAITENPTSSLAIATNGYNGVYTDNISIEDEDTLLADIRNTKLGAPIEMVNMIFLLKGVTRSHTHQIVRYRIGSSYVQESLRFRPDRPFEVFVPDNIANSEEEFDEYCFGIQHSIRAYLDMVERGVPGQDARDILPHGILTSLFWSTSLASLKHIFAQRWCCQAQTDRWIPLLAQMRDCLKTYELDAFLQSPAERGENCGFNANFDRPCAWVGKNAVNEVLK